ncbi:MAG: DUF2335 domain-containing protein [Methylobacterium sp.]|nr:DUF2335 domain-containing protein [Methylobacterium sp.]
MSRRPRGNLPARQKPENEPGRPTLIEERQFWQGPLPPPATLEQFREILPDLPRQIVEQWREESQHRRKLEERSLEGNLRTVRLGQIGAIGFGLTSLGVSGLGFWLGYPVEASAITCTTVVGVVGAFLYQRKKAE